MHVQQCEVLKAFNECVWEGKEKGIIIDSTISFGPKATHVNGTIALTDCSTARLFENQKLGGTGLDEWT